MCIGKRPKKQMNGGTKKKKYIVFKQENDFLLHIFPSKFPKLQFMLFPYLGLEPLESKTIESLVNANEGAAFLLDEDTLTPFLKAVKVGNLATITTLNELSPEATRMEDSNGQTLWHLLVNQPEYLTWRLIRSSQQQNLKCLLDIKDWEGKTPLHLAVESRQFRHAKYFIEYGSPSDEPEARQKWMREYLELETKDGITSSDLIRSSPQVPDYVSFLIHSISTIFI